MKTNRHKLFIIIFLTTFSLQLLAQNHKEVFPSDSSYSLKYPDNWITIPSVKKMNVMIVSPKISEKDSFQENVIVFSEKNDEKLTLEEVYQKFQKEIPTKVKSYKLIEKGNIKVNNLEAIWFVFEQDNTTKNLAYLFHKWENSYIVLSTAKTSTYAEYEKYFKEISYSFKFRK